MPGAGTWNNGLIMTESIVARRLKIKGVVQGVGFRPFLFGLARKYDFKGEVSNTSDGVLLDIEGSPDKIDQMVEDIYENSPLLASVTHVDVQDLELRGFSYFKIIKSQASDTRATLISPDVTVCDDCLAELNDPDNRRYGYPFINCTNCGPRYTIIQDVPYDRPKTSMKSFVMCRRCQAEYDNPLDRRFHAQPNACHVCGPHAWLTDAGRNTVEDEGDPVFLAAKLLEQGKILAVKGLGGFHLAADATNHDTVMRLRDKKARPHKPLALMTSSIENIRPYVHIDSAEEKLLLSYHRPIVLLKKKRPQGEKTSLSAGISPLNSYYGVMLPYTPLHHLLLSMGPDILVMTSGNRSGEPLSIDNDDALDAFPHIADYFLLHNRDIYFRADDSIMHVQAGAGRFIRRSRGFAPLPVVLDRELPEVLACGGGLKSTVCLVRQDQAFLSQHIGDLDNETVFNFFQDTIAHMEKILDIHPRIIAHDMHPGYLSTGFARKRALIEKEKGSRIKCIEIQHHHAHAVSCMAENALDKEVIAITLDGTGYGIDGHIWGGEILTCTRQSFVRRACLKYLPMPGSDAAVKEPWRMALSCLAAAIGHKDILKTDIEFMRQVDLEKAAMILQMIEKNINSPLTSSCGRLFDAVASLLCIRHSISYESQAAMELEAVAHDSEPAPGYEYDIKRESDKGGSLWILDLSPCFKSIVRDLKGKSGAPLISRRFHQTLVDVFVDAALKVIAETGIRDVVLSGGVFHNTIILEGIVSGLETEEHRVFTHSKVPAGDGGISLGQAVIAAALADGDKLLQEK